ncbi:hypothetical protein ABWJ92_33325 [Streptomyces sp. NPDC000609]|uniref:hypothetical protein n=1 Tax=Streptomyces sp. NPDC000609 TaxID=3160957 RepID=UPI00339A0476
MEADRRGTVLHLARLRATARRSFDRHRLATRLGPDAVHDSVGDAMTAPAGPGAPTRQE